MELSTTIETAETQGVAKVPRRPRWGPWATLAWGIPIALTMVISQTLGVFAFGRWWNLAHPERPIEFHQLITHGGALAFSLAISTPFLVGIVAYVVHLSRVPLRDYLALKLPRWRDVGIGVATLVAVLLTAGVVASISGQETPEFMTATFASARAAGMLPLLLLSFVFLGPLQEELLFRGFLFRGFAPAFGIWPTIAVTALAWALMHAQYSWFFVGEIFALGLALGWLRARSGSLILVIGLHATVNGMALIEMAFLTSS